MFVFNPAKCEVTIERKTAFIGLGCDHRCFCYGMPGRPHLVLAPDEFRDVPRYLDPLLSSKPAVGSKRSCSAPNVTPMRPPKRNTQTFTVAVRSIPKSIGSIKIRSDHLFEFQTEERIFPI